MISTAIYLGSAASIGPIVTADELGYLALGIVFLAIGLITLLLTILRTASRDASVFLFGAMSCVWGIRFLLYTHVVPVLLSGGSPSLERVARGLTYFGATAAFGFARAYLGPGWRSTLRVLAWLSLLFSVVASLMLLLNPDRNLLLPVFNVLVLVGAGLVMANALEARFRGRTRHDGLILGFALSLFFFVLENLRALAFVRVPFDVEWIGVLVLYVTLGRLIAVRLFGNERRLASLHQELETARGIQRSLLPKQAPRISGVSIVTRYVPMSQVAGDIYDFVEIADTRLAILIADVSGHGVPAALIASMVKGAFRAQLDVMDKPDLVLSGMNRILTGELEAKYVTATCALIDMDEMVLRCSSAGHPPMLVCDGSDSPYHEMGSNGLILGQFPGAVYACTEQPLAPGGRMILFTDGITEAENQSEDQYGDEAMHRFLASSHELPPDDLADALIASVYEWTGQDPDKSLEDDLTLIVVDVHDSA